MFVSYVEASEDVTLTNNMKPWTYACITLRPSRNLQGYQNILTLTPGEYLNSGLSSIFPCLIGFWDAWTIGDRLPISNGMLKYQILNRTKDKYDWDNDELEGVEGLV